nr:N-lysine methyltransferase SETD6 isoform X2 [Ipomoea batatas]
MLHQDVSMDFIEGLPVVRGKSVIFVVVDRLSKIVSFVVNRTIELYLRSQRYFGPFQVVKRIGQLEDKLALLDEELYFGGDDANNLVDLRQKTVDFISEFSNRIKEDTKICAECTIEKENSLLQWAESNGVKSKLRIAYVEGAGRGAIATQDLKVGDIALEVPISVIISENLVQESDMYSILKVVDGMSSETMLLLWSMKEKHNRNSKFKLYFDTLPEAFNTGLSFGVEAIMTLDGTLLLEEIVQAKEHLRLQYDELFPALCNDHPDIFPPELYTWEQFLWACELWYSNSMKIMFSDGKLRTCLIPIAGFLNHSTSPHILHYGKVDSTTNTIRFPLSRPCSTGEQCFLSYGNFSSSHLLTFYGFLPRLENPYDVIPLDIDTTMDEGFENADIAPDWTSHMVRGTWFSKNHGVFHYGLPFPLLDHMRRARNPSFKTIALTQENLEIELEILGDLCSTFEAMMESLGDAETDDHCDNVMWDVKLAVEFTNLQRRIVSSIVNSCKAGCELLECELQKCMP